MQAILGFLAYITVCQAAQLTSMSAIRSTRMQTLAITQARIRIGLDLQQPGAPQERSHEDPAAVMEFMRASTDYAEGQKQGCSAVGRIVRPVGYEFEHTICNKDQDLLMSMGADTLIMQAMRRFPQDELLQRECASALSAMAQWNEPVYTKLGDSGAVEAIASAINNNPDSQILLSNCGALGSFTDFPGPGAERNLERTAQSGVTPTILNGMMSHMDDSGIILSGLCFFSNACRPAALNAQMVDAGYIEQSVKMMQRWKQGAPGVRGEVVWVNDECFAPRADYRERLAKAGFIPEVVDTLKSINQGGREDVMTNERTFSNAVHMLKLFADGDAAHLALIKEVGGVDVVEDGLKKKHVDVRGGCDLLRSLEEQTLPDVCFR